MPTPALFTETGRGPLEHVPDSERWTTRRVYFATTRSREGSARRIDYGNSESDRVSLGMTLVGFGGPELSWADLNRYSAVRERDEVVDLSIVGLLEAGRIDPGEGLGSAGMRESAGWWVAELNAAIGAARDRDLLVYVHGARVDFFNACAFAAQLDHFMGRDMTSLAFSWPSRQNLLAYGVGGDVGRAYRSAESLGVLLELLAQESDAERIHVVCWSAGGRVVASALRALRQRHPELDGEELRARARIGTVYFAAADVPGDEFLEALPEIEAVADRVVVTASREDGALENARRLMGGSPRAGVVNERLDPERRAVVFAAQRLEVIDVSRGAEARGFDISGHRYWFDHPWASSDLILAVRGELAPEARGLEATSVPNLWAIPADYPDRLRRMFGGPPR